MAAADVRDLDRRDVGMWVLASVTTFVGLAVAHAGVV